MSKCKVKIKVDVCGESALDQVTNLVVNKNMEIKAACVKVAKEFNNENDGATVKWATLRQAYYRANKTDRVTCNTKAKPLSVKMHEDKDDSQQEQIEVLTKKLEQSRGSVSMLQNMVDELQAAAKLSSNSMPTFQSAGNNDAVEDLKKELVKIKAEYKEYVQMTEEVLAKMHPTEKVQKSHEEERQEAIASSNKINKDKLNYFNKRLKEDGISKSTLVA